MDAKLDYLRFTFLPEESLSVSPYDQFIKAFPEFLAPELTHDTDMWYKYQYYDFCMVLASHILIFYNSDSSNLISSRRQVSVCIPSHGMWIIDKIFHCPDFRSFLALIQNRALVRFTRIDVCFDDFNYREEGHYHTAAEFWDHESKNEIVSFCRTTRSVKGGSDDSDYFIDCSSAIINKQRGSTYYLGSRKSDRLLRIYDKYKQSAVQAKLQKDDSLFVDSVRYEFELHSRYCQHFVDSILSCDSYSFKDYISEWFRIIDRSTGTRSNTCKTDKKWQSFLDLEFSETIDKPVLFVREKKDSSFDSLLRTINRDLTSLALFCIIHGGYNELVDWIIEKIRGSDFSPVKKSIVYEATQKSFEECYQIICKKLK